MTDSAEAEERLRERLRAKSQQRRESQSSRSEEKGSPEGPQQRKEGKGSPPSSPPMGHQQQQRGNGNNTNRGGGEDFRGGRNGQRHGYRNGRDRNYPRGGGGPHYHHRPPPHHRGGDDWRRNDVDFYGRGPPPPHLRGGPYNNGNMNDRREYEQDRYGREIRRDRRRSRSLSRSRSYSSRSEDDSSRSGGSRSSRGRDRYRRRSHSSSHNYHRRSRSRSRSPLSSDDSVSDSESSRSSVDSQSNDKDKMTSDEAAYTKDQRTVFVSQLVQRTIERDIKKYFSKEKGLKVNQVILLRDKRTGRHKGCAYVELKRMEDVSKAVALSNVAPSFQRFPILVKMSEAEKNHVVTGTTTGVTAPTALTAAQMGQKPAPKPPLLDPNGQLLEAQKMYLGSLDPSITQEHLFCLFKHFGQLEKVALQCDSATGISKGFAFLSFHDPKEANLAIQTMANQVLAGRPMKTGWAVNQIASIPGAKVVTSDEFPPDGSERATNAYKVLGQLTLGVPPSQISIVAASPSPTAAAAPLAASGAAPATAGAAAGGVPRVPTVAEARVLMAASVPGNPVVLSPAPVAPNNTSASSSSSSDPSKVGNADQPTNHILVKNMFDKDQETDPGWENDIKEEFEEEVAKFGKILKVKVMSQEIGGKIYASFETVQGAQSCASSLAGRWFDKRQLAVEFVAESAVPP